MKITFVGTSHGVHRTTRYYTCFMIESGESVYFIDAGAPVTEYLQHNGKRLDSVRAVFTTHAHCDHTSGIPFLANRMNWYMWNTNCDFFLTAQTLIDAVKTMNAAWEDDELNPNRIRFHIPSEGVVFEDENIKVEYIKTAHTDPSYAILVTEGDKRVLFGGDFSQELCKNDVPEAVKEELDLFVCELGHFGLDVIDPYLRECGAKRVYFTHVFPDNQFDDIKNRNGTYPFPIYAPNDGDVVEI